MVICCSGVVKSHLSFPGQFHSLSVRRPYPFQMCLQVIQDFVRPGKQITQSSKEDVRGNLGVRSDSFSAEVQPVTYSPCSVLCPFCALQAWHSLHHFPTSVRSRSQ
ncbi:hypothetical protein AVEN_93734-1 [Araneus ventricosus]|uniref:Uncharacterized protein n=1 Tax=Araneus ventricosus TaxID=182803 RepID=A0A4Y2MCD6_ARAVE|nr:hypothetical protein AVEN_93734-1 [Araneus ventricosus]